MTQLIYLHIVIFILVLGLIHDYDGKASRWSLLLSTCGMTALVFVVGLSLQNGVDYITGLFQ